MRNNICLIIGVLFFSLACKNQLINKGTEQFSNQPETVEELSPDDSTGSTAQLLLNFSVQALTADDNNGTEILLQTLDNSANDPSATQDTLTVSSEISLSAARFSIAAIRIKPNRDLSDKEIALFKKEKDDDKVFSREIDEFAPPPQEDGLDTGNSQQKSKIVLEDLEADKPEKPHLPAILSDPGASPAEKAAAVKEYRRKINEWLASLEQWRKRQRSRIDELRAEYSTKFDERRQKLAQKKERFKDRIKALLENQSLHDKNLKFFGPFIFNAVTGSFEGDSPDLAAVKDGKYHRLEFALKRNWTVEEGDALFGNSLIIKGIYTKNETSVPFELESDLSSLIRVRGEKGALLSAENVTNLAVIFSAQNWFKDVDLSKAKVDEESGIIFLSRKLNHRMFWKILHNIKRQTIFGPDSDKDNKITDEDIAGEGEEETDDESDEEAAADPEIE